MLWRPRIPTKACPGKALIPLVLIVCTIALNAQNQPSQEIKPLEISGMSPAFQLGNHIYFGGQPDQAVLTELAEKGVKTVVNLRTQGEMDALGYDERAAVEAAGMTYVHIAIGGEEPTSETLDAISAHLATADKKPVLLHCASSNRVGYVWSYFRHKHQNTPVDDAVAEGKKAGLRSPKLEAWVREENQ